MGKLGKHDHKLTNLLKAGIFSLVMLAPLISVGVKCAYVIVNKNAKDSYSASQSPNTYLSTEQLTNLEQNHIYQFTNNNSDIFLDTNNEYISISEMTLLSGNGYTGLNKTPNRFQKYGNQNGKFIHIEYTDNTHDYLKFAETDGTTFTQLIQFNFVSKNTTETIPYNYAIKEVIFGTQQSLDNVFNYAIKNLEEQSTFNWVQNTAIYTPLNAMCSGLGITESAIPILLTYWALMTLIYIVFDIIIYLFTKLTHLIGTN